MYYIVCHFVYYSWCFFRTIKVALIEWKEAKDQLEERKKGKQLPAALKTPEQKIIDAKGRLVLSVFLWSAYIFYAFYFIVLSIILLSRSIYFSTWIKVDISIFKDPDSAKRTFLKVLYTTFLVRSLTTGSLSVSKLAVDTLRRRRLCKKRESLPTYTPADPTVVMSIPVYNEPLPNIISTLNAIAASNYPKDKLHVYLGFDDLDVAKTMFTLYRLLSGSEILVDGILADKDIGKKIPKKFKYNGLVQLGSQQNSFIQSLDNPGTPLSEEFESAGYGSPNTAPKETTLENLPMVMSLVYRGIPINICRFPHGGKLSVQKHIFSLISERFQICIQRTRTYFS